LHLRLHSFPTRRSSDLVSGLIQGGACIVSGLALGVDGISHRTAIENRGATIAVLACGVDCCNPSENFNLYTHILKNDGLVISERSEEHTSELQSRENLV